MSPKWPMYVVTSVHLVGFLACLGLNIYLIVVQHKFNMILLPCSDFTGLAASIGLGIGVRRGYPSMLMPSLTMCIASMLMFILFLLLDWDLHISLCILVTYVIMAIQSIKTTKDFKKQLDDEARTVLDNQEPPAEQNSPAIYIIDSPPSYPHVISQDQTDSTQSRNKDDFIEPPPYPGLPIGKTLKDIIGSST